MNNRYLFIIIFLLHLRFSYSMEQQATTQGKEEITKAIGQATQSNCFRSLFELKKRPDMIGTEFQELLKKALDTHMTTLPSCIPSSSLKEACVKKYLQSSIREDYSKKLPQDLQEYLKEYIKTITPPDIQSLMDTIGRQGNTHNKKTLADLYNALIQEDEKIIHSTFPFINQEDKLHFLKNAACITSNWNIISYLINEIKLSDIEIETSYTPVFLKEHLVQKAANSGNLALIKKFFIYENFDVSSLRFDLVHHISEGKNLDIILLLKTANVSEKQMAYPHETIMDALIAKRTLECTDNLKKLSKNGYQFRLERQGGYGSALEGAITSGAPLNFIVFIMNEASKQQIELETLVKRLRYNQRSFDWNIFNLIQCNISKKSIHTGHIGYLAELLKLGSPLILTRRYPRNTLLECIEDDEELSQSAELIALFTP